VKVVSDTGPLYYLMLIEQIDLLPRLFASVSVPATVRAELDHAETPSLVRSWIEVPPSWLSAEPDPEQLAATSEPLANLDEGERAAIGLADRLKVDLILMDDRAGVATARALGFAVTGTLGVLDLAARRGMIDLAAAFARLRATSFHVRRLLLDELLASYNSDRGAR
jgi:predicted nucleic acid-binding protein